MCGPTQRVGLHDDASPLRVCTRVSTEYGLDQDFNSLDNQQEAAEAYVKSQAHEGWRCLSPVWSEQERALGM